MAMKTVYKYYGIFPGAEVCCIALEIPVFAEDRYVPWHAERHDHISILLSQRLILLHTLKLKNTRLSNNIPVNQNALNTPC